MGIVLLLAAGFAMLALASKDEKQGAGSGSGAEPIISAEQFEKRVAPNGSEYMVLTGSGKALAHWALGQGFLIDPSRGVAGTDGTLFLPLTQQGPGLPANQYLDSLLATTDISIWLDVNLKGVVVAGGFNQPFLTYPMVLMTTGAEGWPPIGAYAESELEVS